MIITLEYEDFNKKSRKNIPKKILWINRFRETLISFESSFLSELKIII